MAPRHGVTRDARPASGRAGPSVFGMLAAVLALVMAVAPAGASAERRPAASVTWSTYGYDLQRTGYNPSETTIGVSNASSLHQVWSVDLGAVMIAQAVEAAGVSVGATTTDVVYEGTEHGDFYAIDASDGSIVWQKNLGSIQTSCSDMPDGVFGIGGAGSIDQAAGVIYVAGGDGSIHALDLATGVEQPGWPVTHVFKPPQDHVYGGITEANGHLYVVVASHCDISPYFGRTVEIDVATQPVVKRFYPAGPPSGRVSGGGIWGPGGASVDPSNGHVFVATGNALTNPESYGYSEDVIELSPGLRVLGFNYPGLTGGDVDFGGTPILYQPSGCPAMQVTAKNKSGVLVVYEGNLDAGYTQRLQVASVNDWQFNGIPAWDPVTNMLYIGNSSDSNAGTFRHGMVALKAGSDCTLSLAWQKPVGPNFASVSPPTVANGVVYYGDGYGNREFAFDATTGAKLWNSGAVITGGLYAAPTVVNGQLLVPSWDHVLHAFGP
jgi:outer membrane protein assembly factor BamB